ncbi:hypothetical protein ACROYT_G040369 [Oculina patagonica]
MSLVCQRKPVKTLRRTEELRKSKDVMMYLGIFVITCISFGLVQSDQGLPSYDRPDQVSRRTCYSPSANIQGGVSEAKVYNKDDE